jgi:2-polyprenyl-6-methoxyphenol hydroxylase-like FAD-dependent oxidoreductase
MPHNHWPYGLALWQNQIERVLAGWVSELKVTVDYGHEVTGFAQDDAGVDVELSGGQPLRAQYLIGCDGGRSLIRKAAGIGFPGWDPVTRLLIAEVELDQEPELGLHRDDKGIYSLSRLAGGTRVRVMVPEQQPGQRDEPTLGELRER